VDPLFPLLIETLSNLARHPARRSDPNVRESEQALARLERSLSARDLVLDPGSAQRLTEHIAVLNSEWLRGASKPSHGEIDWLHNYVGSLEKWVAALPGDPTTPPPPKRH
jgi:hypothetical protein